MGYQAKVKKARRYLLDAAQNGGGKGKETPPARDAAIVRRVVAKLWPRPMAIERRAAAPFSRGGGR